MSASIALFNNKGGVGKTSLAYHLAWMFSDLGLRVVAADLDPQANLTAAFLTDEELEELWGDDEHPTTIYSAVQPLLQGTGDIAPVRLTEVDEHLALVAGDLRLSGFEDELSNQWPECLDGKERAFRVVSALGRIAERARRDFEAELVLIDLGPNLGAINRAALIAADFIAIPVSPDLFSLRGLENLGPTVRSWRKGWSERRGKNPRPEHLVLPEGRMQPLGYIVLQHAVRLDRPVKAYDRWIRKIPQTYRSAVLGKGGGAGVEVHNDPHCLSLLKHYRSLMSLAQDARKPVFHLKAADGALGAHSTAAQNARRDFASLARAIADAAGVPIPDP